MADMGWIRLVEDRWHLHYSGQSRDCDGQMSYGSDINSKLKTNYQMENDHDLIERALGLIWRRPDVGPVDIRIERGTDGRMSVTGGGPTEEGYWRETYLICQMDDYDAEFSGYRDHSAERMGY